MSREGGGRLDGCAVQPAEERGGEARVAAAREEARAAVAVVREAPKDATVTPGSQREAGLAAL